MSPSHLTLSDGELLSQAVVAVIDPSSRQLLGTGAVVSELGCVLTAHHVIAGLDTVIIRTIDGSELETKISPDAVYPQADLAVLDAHKPLPVAIPVGLTGLYTPSNFCTKGFQLTDHGLDDALPMGGKVGGRTQVTYVGEHHKYQLAHALALPDTELGVGTSGAPLYDPSTRSIVGVVVSAFGEQSRFSFATEMNRSLCEEWKYFRDFVDRSNANLPTFGQIMNFKGVSEICKSQRESVVDFLRNAELYKKNKSIPRGQFTSAFCRFRKSDKSLLPLVGWAGVGKTTVLALLADSSDQDTAPCLLLRGVDISPGQDGIEGLANQSLMRASAKLGWAVCPRLAEIMQALSSLNGRLIILLDALNESFMSPAELVNGWIPSTLDFLRSNPVKLVVSCRPEYWNGVAPRVPTSFFDLEPERDATLEGNPDDKQTEAGRDRKTNERRVVFLGDFSLQESRQALEKYGLGGIASAEEVSNPFMFSVMEEVEICASTGIERTESIFDVFLQRKVERALLRIDKMIWSRQILKFLGEIGKAMLERGVQHIPEKEVAFASRRLPGCLDALVEERLLLLEADGYHFHHDQIREHIQAIRIDPVNYLERTSSLSELFYRMRGETAVAHWKRSLRSLFEASRGVFGAIRGRPYVPPSVLASSIIYLATENRWSDFFRALDLILLRSCHYPKSHSSRYAFQVSINVISKVKHVVPNRADFFRWIYSTVSLEVNQSHIRDDGTGLEAITRSISRLSVKPIIKVEIIRLLFRAEEPWHWGVQHLPTKAWNLVFMNSERAKQRPTLRSIRRPIADLIYHVLEEDEDVVMWALFRWLDDESLAGLRGGYVLRDGDVLVRNSVTISECAVVCLFHSSSRMPIQMCERILGVKKHPGLLLLKALLISEHDKMAAALVKRVFLEQDELGEPSSSSVELMWELVKGRAAAESLEMTSALLILAQKLCSNVSLSREKRLWAARCVLREYHLCCGTMSGEQPPQGSWGAAIVEELSGVLTVAEECLWRTLQPPCDQLISDDVGLALQCSFGNAIAQIELAAQSDTDSQVTVVEGLAGYVAARTLNQNSELLQNYRKCFELLSKLYDGRVQSVMIRISEIVVEYLKYCGRKDLSYAFSDEYAERIGLYDLGEKIMERKVWANYRPFVSLAIIAVEPIRNRYFHYFIQDDIDVSLYEDFVKELLTNFDIYEGPAVEVLSARTYRWRTEWDRVVLKYISLHGLSPVRWKVADIVSEYFADLGEGLGTDLSRAYLEGLQRGLHPGDAATASLRDRQSLRRWWG